MDKNKPEIYTIANAHLDTSWLWTLEQTIDDYIPGTLKENFRLLDKYPEYKFNFEGSYRYELIKEYYPEEYEKLKKYINDGRWYPVGSCFENGDVNIPSPEALIRNILYGNGFFRKEFGVESNDIFLPDCFGFGKALPTVSAHSGLTGFSTGKLFWGCSVDVPFDIGRWMGADGKGFWAAIMPFSYTTSFKKMSKARRVLEKLENSKKKNLPEVTFAYHGNGDRGGAPQESSVRNVVEAQKNNANSDTAVYSASPTEFFDMLEAMPEDEKKKMPVYDGEFLLTAHGAGSYTSRTVTKRWNRRCELLADAAERFSSAAFINGFSEYPQYGFDSAWKKVIAHHFHDDITGTSFEECYKRSHNDYVQAMNTFSSEYISACKGLSENLDTSFVTGIPVVVSNPLQTSVSRKEAVRVIIKSNSENFAVYDKNGAEVPSQTKKISSEEKEVTFIADVLSCGLAVYDLRESVSASKIKTDLSVTDSSIENRYISVKIDKNGDICSVFDKELGKELLKNPIRLAVHNNVDSFAWPAWEIKYKDLCEKPYMYAADPEIRIADSGEALCSIEIKRTAGKSRFTQIISLDCESRFVSVYNETDWREEAALLKAEFSFTAENENADYDIGIGYVTRPTNTEKLCEVPAQKWADITDKSGNFGVAVFSDSRAGWDKPDGSTLRLTLVHTPMANYRHECSQHVMDMGINRYSFAVKGHGGNPADVNSYADAFCQPMHTFVTEKHEGSFGKEYSFVNVNNESVRITAVKKAQDSDAIILRVAECSGNNQNGVEVSFDEPIAEVTEVRGDEIAVDKFELTDGKISFDIGHNSIRSFAVTFKSKEKSVDCGNKIALDFNAVGITDDSSRHESTLRNGVSIPREMLPDKLLFAGAEYSFSSATENCLVCDGGKIAVGNGFGKVNLLLTSLNGDKKVSFGVGKKTVEVTVPDCFEALGHWDLMRSRETGYVKSVPQALTLTHTHNKDGNLTAKQFYLFCAEIPLYGESEISLPVDEDIVIFAATAVKETSVFIKGDSYFDSLEKREFDYEFTDYALKHMYPNRFERFLDKLIDRTFTMNIKTGEFYNKYSLGDLYFIFSRVSDTIKYKHNVKKFTDSHKQ